MSESKITPTTEGRAHDTARTDNGPNQKEIPAHAEPPTRPRAPTAPSAPELQSMPFLGCYRIFGLGAILPAWGTYQSAVEAGFDACPALIAGIVVYLVCSYFITLFLARIGYK